MFHADYANYRSWHIQQHYQPRWLFRGGSLGIAHFFNPHLSLETALYMDASGYKTQLLPASFGLSIGLYAFLDKKKKE